jgi:hypothetical protein
MSWQAVDWAMRQTTGNAGRKLLLMALASYANQDDGICWPSQATLARDTEQSVDTVQRQLTALLKLTLIKRERMPKRRGQWQGYLYKLPLQSSAAPKGQTAARCHDLRSGQAAKSAITGPQGLRHKPSLKPSYEPSYSNMNGNAAERLQAFREKQEGPEIVQDRIARRIGDNGWLVLGEMTDAQRARLTTLERQGRLDDETLATAIRAVGYVGPL